jgi:DNA polymerase type B, organellar and viral
VYGDQHIGGISPHGPGARSPGLPKRKGRGRHLLKSAKGSALPKQIATIQTQSRLIPIDEEHGYSTDQLQSWRLLVYSTEGKRPGEVIEHAGENSAQFWSVIGNLLQWGITTWLFSASAARDMHLLGLWEMIDDGSLYLAEVDNRYEHRSNRSTMRPVRGAHAADSSGGQVNEMEMLQLPGSVQSDDRLPLLPRRKSTMDAARGYLILEDPPTIACLRQKGRSGMIKWVDMRNYAMDFAGPAAQGVDVCQEMMTTVLAMVEVIRSEGLGSFQATAASQSMHSYKKKYLKHTIYVHDNQEVLSLERAAYFGGRCEVALLNRTQSPVHYLDIASMYTALGARKFFPVRYCFSMERPGITKVLNISRDYAVIADVDIETDRTDFPCAWDAERDCPLWDNSCSHLGRQRKNTDLVVYPTGHFRTVLCGPELENSIIGDNLRKIHFASFYEESKAFSEYCTDLLRLRQKFRQEGKKPEEEWIKRLGVSLWGKFGQSGHKWVDMPNYPCHRPWHRWYHLHNDGTMQLIRSIGQNCQLEVCEPESLESCPAIAAYMNSYGRMQLLSLLRMVPTEQYYYCDTDSLWVGPKGYRLLREKQQVGSGEPGRLRLKDTYKSVTWYGLKYYEKDGEIVCAGRPKGESVSAIDEEYYWHRDWLGSQIGTGERPVTEWILREYNRKRPYRHGRVDRNGWVTPFHCVGF